MVKEKLRKALEDAVGFYNGGMSADDAVVKSASEHDLTVDQTDRVVESFNTAKTINYFDKTASDRTGSFDLASKRNVTLKLFGDIREKKASASLSSTDGILESAFYAGAPDTSTNRKSAYRQKRAELLDAVAEISDERWSHGYSDATLQDMAADACTTLRSAEKDAESAIGIIDSYLLSAQEKIASDLSRRPYGSGVDAAGLFKSACPHKEVVGMLEQVSPILKKASSGRYDRMAVVDTTPVDDLLKEADDISYALGQRKVYVEKKAELQSRLASFKAALFKDPSLSKYASSKTSDLVHRPRTVKAAGSDGDNIFSTDNLFGVVYDGGTRRKINERIRDEARGALLSDLLSSDPILQDADPRQVASIYKSIVNSSPRVSLNKEVVRSVLRGAVNSIAVSPADVKVLTDVDKGMQQAFGGIGKDDSGN